MKPWQLIAASALATLLWAPSFIQAITVQGFPLPNRHSEIVAHAQNIVPNPGPICRPDHDEFLVQFDEAAFLWVLLASINDDGSANLVFIQFKLDGDPVMVFKAHSPAEDNDSIVIDRVLPYAEAQQIYPGACAMLYPKQA